MNKKEFLDKLKRKLSVLNKNEISDIIDEYGGYIDEKVKKGKSEKEAIKDFGDFDELVKEILSAYKINEDFDEETKVGNVIANLFDDIATTIDNLVKKINNMGSEAVIKFVFEMILVIIGISILHFPFRLVINMGVDIFNVFSHPISTIFIGVWKFIIEIVYLILAIIVFVKYFKERYIVNIEEEQVSMKKERKEKTISEIKPETLSKPNIKKEEKIYEPVNSLKSFTTAISVIGKIFAILFAIPTIFVLVGLVIAFVFACIMIGWGIHFIGIPMILLSFLITCGMFLDIMFKVIASKKTNVTKIFTSLIISIIFFGVGCAFTAVEFANSTYNNNAPSRYEISTQTIEIMPKDLDSYYFNNYLTKYIVDETLVDKVVVKVDYYNDFIEFDLKNSFRKYNNGYYWNNNDTKFNGKDFFEVLKEDFKTREFHNYALLFEPRLTIYGTEENLNKITNNRNRNYQYEDNIINLEGRTFTRTYSLLNIADDDEANSYYLTLKEINGPTSFVKVEGLLIKLNSGKTYDFTFKIIDDDITDDIESIFENTIIVEVKQNDGQNIYGDSFCLECY